MPIREKETHTPMDEQEAIKSAKLLVDIFEKNHIEYWFDYGTLLGIIRSKKFIPWDTDIETYIRYKDSNVPNILIKELEAKGFTLEMCPFSRGYSKGVCIEEGNGYSSMSVGFFKDTYKARFFGWICYHLPTFVRLWIIHYMQKHYNQSKKESIRPQKQEDRDKSKVSSWVRACFPIFFCSKLKKVDFYDIKVSVPAKAEELLLMRYGEEWRIPKKVFRSYTT